MKAYLTIFLLIFLLSCKNNSEDDSIVATVGTVSLMVKDLPDFSQKVDSAELRSAFIDSWIKKQLLIKKALENLSAEQSNFDKQLEDYKNSLLIYAFENQIVKQKLDTTISNKKLKAYYEENKENFKLKEDFAKGIFIKYINTAPKIDSLNIWINGKVENSNQKLIEFCSQFAVGCYLDTTSWISFSKIKELELFPTDKNLNLVEGFNTHIDTNLSYSTTVFELKKSGEVSPLPIVEDQIKSILLNKRKIQLIDKVKEEIFESATLNEEYEIYN